MKSSFLYNASLMLVGLLWLLTGCASQEIPEQAPIPKEAPPSFEHRSTDIEVLSFETARLRAVFTLQNPGDVPLSLEQYRYTLESGVPETQQSGQEEPGLNIPAGGEESIEIKLQMPLGTPLPADADTADEKDPAGADLPFSLALEARVSAADADSRTLRASTTNSIQRPELPQVSVSEVIIRQFETRIIRLEYVVKVRNPNSFAVRYSPQPHEFLFAGKPWVEEALPGEFRLEAGEDKSFAMPLQINYMQAGRRTVDILIGDKAMEYVLTGQAEASPAEAAHAAAAEQRGYQFSFEHSGTAKIIRP